MNDDEQVDEAILRRDEWMKKKVNNAKWRENDDEEMKEGVDKVE